MLNISNLLNIYFREGIDGYTDNTMVLGNPSNNTALFTGGISKTLYLGYKKPIKNIFFDIETVNSSAFDSVFTIKYHNGTTWTEIDYFDETEGFKKSGVIQWAELSDQAESEVNESTMYWISITSEVLQIDTAINYIGLLLSTDEDLVLENPYIMDDDLLMGQSNHLKAHISARDEIVQSFANKGNIKTSGESLSYWDMLNASEFRMGSIFLALSKIYFNLSDRSDDMWLRKSEEYRKRYLDQIDLYFSTIDLDDDGVTDTIEKSASATCKTMVR